MLVKKDTHKKILLKMPSKLKTSKLKISKLKILKLKMPSNYSIYTPLSTLYNSLILKGLKFNSFLAKNCKPSIYRALEKRVESQVIYQKFNEKIAEFQKTI